MSEPETVRLAGRKGMQSVFFFFWARKCNLFDLLVVYLQTQLDDLMPGNAEWISMIVLEKKI